MDLLQVHASGLGACCMAGPMIARDEVCGVLNNPEPWRMLGAVGYPVLPLPEAKPRKALGKVVEWF